MNNVIREAVEIIGMHPDGALIGALGAIVAVVGKINGHGFKASMAIILGGFTMCGYLLPVFNEHLSFLEGTVFFLIFIVGYVSKHIYEFLDTSAPRLLQLLFLYVSTKLPKKDKK